MDRMKSVERASEREYRERICRESIESIRVSIESIGGDSEYRESVERASRASIERVRRERESEKEYREGERERVRECQESREYQKSG